MFYWVKQAFSKTFDFKGRARRKEFWFFNLFYFLVIVGISLLEEVNLHLNFADNTERYLSLMSYTNILEVVVSFVFFVPLLSVSVRRFHDMNKNAGLVYFISFVSALYLLISVYALIAFNGVTEAAMMSLFFEMPLPLLQVMTFFPYIYLICFLIAFVMFMLKGTDGENRFGEDPIAMSNKTEKE